MMFCFICAILSLFSRVEGSIEAVEQIHSVTSCYNSTNTISASCPNGTVIAVYEFYYGFKNKSSPCTSSECCDYEEGDCLQPNTVRDVMYALSGNQNGQTPTVNIAVGATCQNETSEAVSSFNLLKYMCILENRTWNIYETVAVNVTSELPVYIESPNYPGPMPGESQGTCSVEASSATKIEMYTLHAEFNYVQRLDIVDDSHGFLATIDCNTTVFGFIAEESLNTTYVNISLFNNDTGASGKFWIGFKATSDDTVLNINCPAQPRIVFKGCGNVTASEGTNVVYTDAYDSTATASCADGYLNNGGDETRTCQANNTWSGEPYTCIRAPGCGNVTASEGTNVVYTDAYDSTATASCADGYLNNGGDETRTCQANNTWSGEPYTCIRAPVCQELPRPPHGNITTSDGYVGDAVEYSCDEGYDHNAQNATRVCTETGDWTGDALVCEPKGGEEEGVNVNENIGLVPEDNNRSRIMSTAVFTFDCAVLEIKCSRNDCGPLPNLANGNVDVPTTTFGSHANYSCLQYYNIASGDAMRTCQADGSWSGQQPVCSLTVDCVQDDHCPNNYACVQQKCIYTCRDPPQLSNGAVDVNNRPIIPDSTATYRCEDGNTLQGDPTRTCINGSGWTGAEQTCVKRTTNDSIALAIVVPILLLIILALVLFILYQKGTLCRPKHQILIEEGKPHDDGNNKTDNIQCQSMSTLKSKDETETVKESEGTAKGDAKCPIANAEGVDLDHAENKNEKKEETAPDKESGGESSAQTSEQPEEKEASNDGKEPGDSKVAEGSSHGDKAAKTAASTNLSDSKGTDLIDFGGTQQSADSSETLKGEGSKETVAENSTDAAKEGNSDQSKEIHENSSTTDTKPSSSNIPTYDNVLYVKKTDDAILNDSNEPGEEEPKSNALDDNAATVNQSEPKNSDDKTDET